VTGDGPVSVLLVDDHPLVRPGLRAVLSAADAPDRWPPEAQTAPSWLAT
jgi:DNA-binding NarL/FixJ family response regulator